MSESARLTVQVQRKVGKRFRPSGRATPVAVEAGNSTLRNALRKLCRGRYRVTVTATDAAGNRSTSRLEFRVR